MTLAIVELYCGTSGVKGYYNSQEVGLGKEMADLGYDVYVFYADVNATDITEEIIDNRVTLVSCPARAHGVHGRFDFSILKKYDINVVHLGADNQLFAPDLLRYCDRNGIRAYCYIGVVESDTDSSIKRTMMRALFARNVREYRRHKCFAKTEHVKGLLGEYGIKDVDVAHVGLDTSIIPQVDGERVDIRYCLGIPADKTVILFVGRIDEYKRPLNNIRLFEDSALRDKCHLVIIGTGALNGRLKEELEKADMQENTTWIERLPNAEIHEYYAAADYYVNYNEKEIFGMGILEAMYQSCNVIAFHAPGPDTIIDDDRTGYLVDDIEEMREIIKSGCRLDGDVVKQSIVDGFTWESTARKLDLWIQGC